MNLQSEVEHSNIGTTFAEQTSLDNLIQNASATNHKFLQSVYNWLMRKNFGGARAVEAILLQYGVKVPNYRLQYSEYCGKVEHPLEIMDITQTANTAEGNLGEYGGKAYSVNVSNEKLSINTEEDGIFLVMTSLVINNGLCQGIDRSNLVRESPEEYYQPELERTGMQPIYVGELYEGKPTIISPLTKNYVNKTQGYYNERNLGWNKLFGFAPRYTAYKVPRNNITGDFKLNTLGGGIYGELNAWHLMRMIDEFSEEIQDIPTDNIKFTNDYAQKILSFTAQKGILYDNGQQYNRIFNVEDNQQDHIFAIMQFEARLDDTKLPISSSIDLDGFAPIGANQNGDVMQ